MKGLFIGLASDDPASSPNLSVATAGDVLRLRARVYNFSLADMPLGSKVRVRFYGQLYDGALGRLSGDGFLIGEDSIAPIPAFKSNANGGTLPNWAFASTTFDTTPYSGQLLVFWVVAWGEDAGGTLLAEQTGHGLTQNPAGLSFTQITDVPVEGYSNNVGMFGVYTPFAVLSRNHSEAADTELLAPGDLQVEASPVTAANGFSDVTVTIHNAGNGFLAEPVVLYDGDPDNGGTVFEVQQVPYVKRGETYRMHTHLRPQSKGVHTIYARVGSADSGGSITALTSLMVP
jgi:hypothetical protein